MINKYNNENNKTIGIMTHEEYYENMRKYLVGKFSINDSFANDFFKNGIALTSEKIIPVTNPGDKIVVWTKDFDNNLTRVGDAIVIPLVYINATFDIGNKITLEDYYCKYHADIYMANWYEITEVKKFREENLFALTCSPCNGKTYIKKEISAITYFTIKKQQIVMMNKASKFWTQ